MQDKHIDVFVGSHWRHPDLHLVQFVTLFIVTVANPYAQSKHIGFTPGEQDTQFGGQSLQIPSCNVDPTLQFKHIDKLLAKQETQMS
jgi:hypothetical protein